MLNEERKYLPNAKCREYLQTPRRSLQIQGQGPESSFVSRTYLAGESRGGYDKSMHGESASD